MLRKNGGETRFRFALFRLSPSRSSVRQVTWGRFADIRGSWFEGSKFTAPEVSHGVRADGHSKHAVRSGASRLIGGPHSANASRTCKTRVSRSGNYAQVCSEEMGVPYKNQNQISSSLKTKHKNLLYVPQTTSWLRHAPPQH